MFEIYVYLLLFMWYAIIVAIILYAYMEEEKKHREFIDTKKDYYVSDCITCNY